MVDDMFGFLPHNIELYKLALIHRSASVNTEDGALNNERLEFLGDAVIETVTSDYLFIAYPSYQEGDLTKLRSKIVSRTSLNDLAERVGLAQKIVFNHVSNQQKHIYGDAFEAMMGAVYLDQGYNFVNKLLINFIFEKYLSIDDIDDAENDFKSRLVEWCQKEHHTVRFKTRGVDTKSAGAHFRCDVVIDGIEMGHGMGLSKKEAEQKAAESLSKEMSDAQCAKILDRFDSLSASARK